MSMQNEEGVFGKNYGSEFEEKLLYNLLTDKTFFTRVINILREEYFQTKPHRYLMNIIKDVWETNNKIPTLLTFKLKLKHFKDEIARKKAFKTVYYFFEKDNTHLIEDYEAVQKEVVDYCRQQNWRLRMQVALDHIDEFKFDQAQAELEKGFYEGMENKLGLRYEDIKNRLETTPRKNIVPTPWEPLNKRIGGGLGSGELFVIVAPMGTGKTHIATNLAMYGKKCNFDVIIYSLEQSKEYSRMRMDSLLLKKDIKEDDIKDHIHEIEEELKKYTLGRISIQKLSSGSTALDIKNDIRLHKASQFNPKLIIIDYLDLMEPINTYDKKKPIWDKLEVITREVRNIICDGEEVSGYGLAQGNTSSMELRALWAQNTSGGIKRLHPADIIGGYARNIEMKEEEMANFTMIKNRFGRDGFILPASTDYSISHIAFQDHETYSEGQKDPKEIKNETFKFLKERINKEKDTNV